MRLSVVVLLMLIAPFTAEAQTTSFQGIGFDVPANVHRVEGGPKPPRPFLRFRDGVESDAKSETLEVMAGPRSELGGKLTAANYAEVALTPASMFCGKHQVLRNTSEQRGKATVVSVGYVCEAHSRQPQFSRQVVRATAVFLDDQLILFMHVRRWLDRPHADDSLPAEEWFAPSDTVVASIQPAP